MNEQDTEKAKEIEKKRIKPFQRFKLRIKILARRIKLRYKKFLSNKRRNFFIKQYLIYGIIVFLGIILLFYYLHDASLISTSPEQIFLIFLSKYSQNIAIVLIPTILALSSIKKKYKEELTDLFSLKEKALTLRKKFGRAIIEKEKDPLLAIDPMILEDIKYLLRNFGLFFYADNLNEFLERSKLFQIDALVIQIIKVIKKYDKGKDYDSLKNNYETKRILKKINLFNAPTEQTEEEKEELRSNFLKDIMWVLIYQLFYDKANLYPAFSYYYKELDTSLV